MPELRWPRRGRFRDADRDVDVQGPDATVDVDDEDVVERYLDRGFVRADADDGDQDGSDEQAQADEGGSDGSEPQGSDVEDGLPDGPSGPLPFNPEAQTVDDIRDQVDDVDDPEAVRALRNLETQQKDRTTAVEAFDDRLTELKGD